jgi:hypothetical protein
MAREEKSGVEKRKNTLTVRPGACLGGMAGQCPRGRLDATRGSLHRGTTGSTASGASTGVQSHQDSLGEAPRASEREAGEDWSSVVAEGVKSRAGSGHGSPRRGGGQQNYLVEVEEGAAASISPKVATAKVTGAGRNRQATAAANQIARGTTREREGGDWGWAGSV